MRIYVDANVFGTYPANSPQEVEATRFFSQLLVGRYTLVTSPLMAAEVGGAPAQVQALFRQLSTLPTTEWLRVDATSEALANAYVSAGVVTANHFNDALHIALATVAKVAALTSWNARDFTNKAVAYNQVNLAEGYGTIVILTPDEVLKQHP